MGGFEEFGESLCPRVRFFDEDHACAVTDNQLAFFSLVNVTSPELVKQVPVEGGDPKRRLFRQPCGNCRKRPVR